MSMAASDLGHVLEQRAYQQPVLTFILRYLALRWARCGGDGQYQSQNLTDHELSGKRLAYVLLLVAPHAYPIVPITGDSPIPLSGRAKEFCILASLRGMQNDRVSIAVS